MLWWVCDGGGRQSLPTGSSLKMMAMCKKSKSEERSRNVLWNQQNALKTRAKNAKSGIGCKS
jgi:hypothetical protein